MMFNRVKSKIAFESGFCSKNPERAMTSDYGRLGQLPGQTSALHGCQDTFVQLNIHLLFVPLIDLVCLIWSSQGATNGP
jgi:hypothetical protein